MRTVAIIGAGELGGATAHALARSNLVRSITLIDDARRVAAGKALDIAQAAPVEGFATQLSGATDVSLAVNGSPRDIALSVLGVPPAHAVIPWADATMAGFALTRLIDEPSRRRLSARVTALWPPGPYALAAAATVVVEAMAGRSRRAASCFVASDPAGGPT